MDCSADGWQLVEFRFRSCELEQLRNTCCSLYVQRWKRISIRLFVRTKTCLRYNGITPLDAVCQIGQMMHFISCLQNTPHFLNLFHLVQNLNNAYTSRYSCTQNLAWHTFLTLLTFPNHTFGDILHRNSQLSYLIAHFAYHCNCSCWLFVCLLIANLSLFCV